MKIGRIEMEASMNRADALVRRATDVLLDDDGKYGMTHGTALTILGMLVGNPENGAAMLEAIQAVYEGETVAV